jgi:hypothetical protein
MSHVTKHKNKVNNVSQFLAIAEDLGHTVTLTTEVKMYGSQKVDAVGQVLLKDWRYPVAVDKDGGIYYDHFGSAPNSMRHFGELFQEYNCRRTEQLIPVDEVESYYFQELENGDKKLVLEYA